MKAFSLRLLRNLGLTLFIIFISGFIASCVANGSNLDEIGSTPEGVNTIVNGNNQFAFELYSKFNEQSKEENIFFSPYSIVVALTMTYEGARGKTAEEMRSVLHIPEDAKIRRSNYAKIINVLNNKDKKYKLSTANALWAQKDYIFLDEYINTVDKYYGGKVTNLDFISQTEESRQTINTWVEDQTNKKIKDLIPQGMINIDTRLVLTNALYFKGMWIKQFEKKETQDKDFKTGSGQNVKVPMMKLTGKGAAFYYGENDEMQMLEMPYDGEELSMVIILPKDDTLNEIDESITSEKWTEWKALLSERRVDVYLPKFKFETKYFMVNVLKEMGMPTAFEGSADFSGMDGSRSLSIAEVIHQTFIDVNEEGTEAAAATAVILGKSTEALEIPVFRADHPFIFFIQQKNTGNILFFGKVCDPSK